MILVLPSFELILVYCILSVLAVQFLYYLFFYLRISFVRRKKNSGAMVPVSVIVCAKNAADYLQDFLPLVLEQDYPEFEVVVVNDCSYDDTETVLARLSNKYKHLRHTSLFEDAKFKHGKKLALTVGIKSAKHETLVLTDADCYPTSDKWLQAMVSNFSDTKTIVLGYGGYEAKKGILDKIIRYDALFIAMNYLSFAHAGVPYMGVGRNLAYKKKVFWDNNGFESHYFLTSGDDDLFINEVANKKNTTIDLSKDSITRSIQKSSFKEWYFQKKRHSVTSKLYKRKHKMLLGLEPFTRVLTYLFVCAYLIMSFDYFYYYVIGGFALRLVIQLFVIKLAMKRLDEKKLLLYSPLIDMIIPFFYFILLFTKKNSYYYNRKWN